MFRATSLSIIRSSKQNQDGTVPVPSWLCLEAVITNLHETYQCRMYGRENSRWWAKKLPEICRVLWQNKFWIISASVLLLKKSVTAHANMNVNFSLPWPFVILHFSHCLCNLSFPSLLPLDYLCILNWEECHNCPVFRYYSGICPEILRKPTKSISIASLRVEIWA
jgi:hypothetical protein